ncbi:MAG: Zinc ribbon domain protein [Deltaproteobacteria bacterium ADurb.Bin151]|jgi:putative FmdB family regulatory protein|nr:zinc ribbon domain-containing protein [Smithella sp.]OQB56811.1 MAG: Zinc ribbon domain protein [Deltaproteobacteria bacterium ADurb.Bin151]HOG81581.1 zinc ribbon domain-containing protein [Smithellaceae bacterium]HRY35661.1 zinc ribbon domain-containing protein [Smithellaceae bacterium]
MPIYEYRCKKCGKQFEAFQGITEPDLKTCKFCKGKVQKMMSLSSFTLKGTGWYATDYAGKKPGSAKTAKKEETSADSASTTSDAPSVTGSKEE